MSAEMGHEKAAGEVNIPPCSASPASPIHPDIEKLLPWLRANVREDVVAPLEEIGRMYALREAQLANCTRTMLDVATDLRAAEKRGQTSSVEVFRWAKALETERAAKGWTAEVKDAAAALLKKRGITELGHIPWHVAEDGVEELDVEDTPLEAPPPAVDSAILPILAKMFATEVRPSVAVETRLRDPTVLGMRCWKCKAPATERLGDTPYCGECAYPAQLPPEMKEVPGVAAPDFVPGPTGGGKADAGKPPLSYVPRELLEGAARAYAYGAKKYQKDNFRKGMQVSRLVDALLRHVYALNEGEEFDSESGLRHEDHAAATLGMLMNTTEAIRKGRLPATLDDRWKGGA